MNPEGSSKDRTGCVGLLGTSLINVHNESAASGGQVLYCIGCIVVLVSALCDVTILYVVNV